MLPAYVTRESIKAAFDIKSTARADAQVDRAIEAASRDVDGDLRRRFYPEDATYTFPAPQCGLLFLDKSIGFDLVSLDSMTVNGVAVAASDRDLLPVEGPPFTRIEFGSSVSFGSDRRPVSITGTWGFDNRTEPAGQLAAAIDDVTMGVDVSDSAAIGVGALVTVESERMIVTGKSMLDTTQDLVSGLTASSSDVTATVADGSTFSVGEVLLVGFERMLIVDIAGNDLFVKRAWDGSVLVAHSVGADVFASRRLTVERGALGTTAAAHAVDTSLVRQMYPGPVVAYAAAQAEHLVLKEITAQGGEVGGRGVISTIDMVRADARRGYRRILLG